MSGCNMHAYAMQHGTYNIPHTPCNMEHTTYRIHHAATSMHIQCASCNGDRSSAECAAQNNAAVVLEAMLHVGVLCCNVARAIIMKHAATSHVLDAANCNVVRCRSCVQSTGHRAAVRVRRGAARLPAGRLRTAEARPIHSASPMDRYAARPSDSFLRSGRHLLRSATERSLEDSAGAVVPLLAAMDRTGAN